MHKLLDDMETVCGLLADKGWHRKNIWLARNKQQISAFFAHSNGQTMVISGCKPANEGNILVNVRVNGIIDVRASDKDFIEACTKAFDEIGTTPKVPTTLGVSLHIEGAFA